MNLPTSLAAALGIALASALHDIIGRGAQWISEKVSAKPPPPPAPPAQPTPTTARTERDPAADAIKGSSPNAP